MRTNIKRPAYFNQIEPYIGDALIKFLTGQRRVGKSFILRQISEAIAEKDPTVRLVYINKEDYTFDHLKTDKELMEYINSLSPSEAKTTLLIDEVQEIEGFEKALRSLQLTGRYDIYCTGSNATLLSGELSTMLAGRYIQIRVFSLTYPEFLVFNNFGDTNGALQKYIRTGGMPHLINLKHDESVHFEYLSNVFDSIVLRDIVSRYGVRNVRLLQDLIVYLADNVGSLVTAKRISDFLKSQKINIQSKTILEYLYYLETVFCIDRVKRTEVNGRKIFEIGDKFYFEDLGIRHCQVPFQLKDIGKVTENLVYHHLKALRYNIYVGKMGDKEIDFVCDRDGKTLYVQVAYLIVDEKTHQREFGNLLNINDNCRKILVSWDPVSGNDYKGIEHWNIRNFLMGFEG
jgi:uncharacterized protein